MNKVLLMVIAVVSILTTYVLSKDYEHFPSHLEVKYAEVDSENLTAYFDIGYGFRQSLRGFVAFTEGSPAKIPLPLRTVQELRIDLDAADNLKQAILIEEMCLTSRNKRHCWSAKELAKTLVPINTVANRSLFDGKLFVQTNGFDPHFTFNLDIAKAHKKVSEIAYFQYVLFTILLSIILYYATKFFLIFILPVLSRNFQQRKQLSFSIPVNVAAAGVALISIILSGSWLIAYEAGTLASLLLVGGITLIAILPSQQTIGLNAFAATRMQYFIQTFSRYKVSLLVLISLLCLLPILSFFSATWVQEFPHLGDHEYHLWGNRVSYQAIQHNDAVLLLSLLTLTIAYFFGMFRLALVGVAILLVSTGLWHLFPEKIASNVHGIFSRYPGGARVLAHPFVHMSYLFEWNDPLNTGRAVNVLSIPMWLLVLRPLIIGRLPSLTILPLILLFFWQAEVIYQFSTAYLDIWSVVFILLAVEKLIVSQTDPEFLDENGYLKACLLLSIACAFKEPAVFIIPWFWFAGWSISAFRGRNIRSVAERLYYAVVVGFASVLPFLVYYAVRKSFGISRYTVKGFEYFLTGDWFAEMANRIGFHFGMLGVAVLCLIALLWLLVLVLPVWRAQRWMMLCILGALLTQVFLFNWDQGGVAFTGYFRFYLPALVLFFAPIILISASRQRIGPLFTKAILAMSALALIGNSQTLYATIIQLGEPDSARNFNEHYDAPIYLPIRSLVKTAEKAGVLEGENRAIHINHVTSWNQPAFVYSDLLIKYKLNMRKELRCNCSNEVPSVLAPFVHVTGLNNRIKDRDIELIKDIPQHQAEYVVRWREVNNNKEICLATMQRSCKYMAQEVLKDGTIVGAIGVGPK